jgi:hypothetical protein
MSCALKKGAGWLTLVLCSARTRRQKFSAGKLVRALSAAHTDDDFTLSFSFSPAQTTVMRQTKTIPPGFFSTRGSHTKKSVLKFSHSVLFARTLEITLGAHTLCLAVVCRGN